LTQASKYPAHPDMNHIKIVGAAPTVSNNLQKF